MPRIICNDKTSSFRNFFKKDGLFLYTTEIFRLQRQIDRGISSSIMKGVFGPRAEHPYNLRFIFQFSTPLVKTIFHGTEKTPFLDRKIWSLLPENFKNIDSFENFKILIKKWKPEDCACRLCRVYIKNVGFLQNQKLYYFLRKYFNNQIQYFLISIFYIFI